jgi:hypothetical protein
LVYDVDGTGIAIYPNPANDEVTVGVTVDTEVSVVDLMGRLVNKVTTNKDQNTLNLSELPKGILIFVVGDQRFKVLKE